MLSCADDRHLVTFELCLRRFGAAAMENIFILRKGDCAAVDIEQPPSGYSSTSRVKTQPPQLHSASGFSGSGT